MAMMGRPSSIHVRGSGTPAAAADCHQLPLAGATTYAIFESTQLGRREWRRTSPGKSSITSKTRVDVVEREVEGEKTVTRHILQQTRRNGDDLAAVKSRLDRHDQRFDNLERRFDGLEREVHGLRADLHGLRNELPTIVGEVMRDVLRERDKKR
jgi:hypothetical protein